MKKNILGKLAIAAFISTMVIGSSAFADTADTTANTETTAVETTQEAENSIEILKNEKSDYVVYKGTVTGIDEGDDGYISVTISETGLKANLASDAVVMDAADGSIKKSADIKEGMNIMVVLGANTPMTMSIPPMTSSVVATIINADDNVDFSVYNDELINAENSLQLNTESDIIVKDIKGEDLTVDDIKNNAAVVAYGISTKSIPAQTTPSLVVVIGDEAAVEPETGDVDEEEEAVDKSPVKLREICENAGYKVKWTSNDEPIEISNGEKTITVTKDSNKCTITGSEVGINAELSGDIYLEGDTMMAPYDLASYL